jgi:hypothetical protein
MLWQFLQALWSDWKALMSGSASIILAAIAAVFSTPLPALTFWLAAYLCLMVTAYRLWAREHQARLSAEGKLTAQSPSAQKEATVREQIANLNHAELRALKHLVDCGQLTEEQLADFSRQHGLDVVTPDMLNRRVTFLKRSFTLAAWSVLPHMELAVRKVMSDMNLEVPPSPEALP